MSKSESREAVNVEYGKANIEEYLGLEVYSSDGEKILYIPQLYAILSFINNRGQLTVDLSRAIDVKFLMGVMSGDIFSDNLKLVIESKVWDESKHNYRRVETMIHTAELASYESSTRRVDSDIVFSFDTKRTIKEDREFKRVSNITHEFVNENADEGDTDE